MIDAQLPPRLAAVLKRAGHEAEHVYELGMLHWPDRDIWRYAKEHGAVIITKDSDFAAMRMQTENGPVVVWLRMGNGANDALAATVGRALPEIVTAIESGEGLIEVWGFV